MEAQLKLTAEDLKEDVILKKSDQLSGLFFLVLNKKTNNFNFDFLRKINEKLEIVESNEGPTCLITTSSSSRYFSTGLDLKMF
jgi:enoyl-CoA hydratase/carnithine racemase